MSPPSTTATRSASCAVWSRWAIATTVRPASTADNEATSLLDPRAARELEASLSAVLTGRTVVAIAHRLHTAHDADRVAVVDGGLITEIGPHDALVDAGGDYARLWHSWQSD